MPKTITHADVRMYRLGTGDCFVIKFWAKNVVTFKVMIDCGAWQGSKAEISKYVTDLKKHVDNQVDLLVVTHEHKDHVLGFELCQDLFKKDFKIGETWMAWTEEDGNPSVEKWKEKDGLKKKKQALAAAAQRFEQSGNDPSFHAEMKALYRGGDSLAAHQRFAGVLRAFSDLHMALDGLGVYAGPLQGMKALKEKICIGKNGKPNIKYRKPGEILENIPGLDGVRIYVLGPPRSMDAVHAEDSAEEGETYRHNKELAKSNAFALAA